MAPTDPKSKLSETNTSVSMSRRSVLGAGALGFLTFPFKAALADEPKKKPFKRLAIIGGGMGGIATAYFCGAEWNVDLFEANAKTGGHADTRRFRVEGEEVSVDIGAEFYEPTTHPLYWNLLTHIGAHSGELEPREEDQSIACAATLNIFEEATGETLFDSSSPLSSTWRAVNFLLFTNKARAFANSDEPYVLSMGDWIDGLSLSKSFKHDVLSPWLASLSCTDIASVRRQSARSHLTAFAKMFPANPLKEAKTYNSKIGVGGNLSLLQNRCENLNVKLNSPVLKLEAEGDEAFPNWYVTTAKGREGPYDSVVVNAPPHIAKDFFKEIPWAQPLESLLGRHEFYPTRIVLHTDPVYMPADNNSWATQNASVGADRGEASVDVGSILKKSLGGKKISLFKSWATHRPRESQAILASRDFQHPLSTPDTMAAIKELHSWQGRGGLHFAGHFTTTTDLQETALFSAIQCANRLAPYSSNLVAFEKLLDEKGLRQTTYLIP